MNDLTRVHIDAEVVNLNKTSTSIEFNLTVNLSRLRLNVKAFPYMDKKKKMNLIIKVQYCTGSLTVESQRQSFGKLSVESQRLVTLTTACIYSQIDLPPFSEGL